MTKSLTLCIARLTRNIFKIPNRVFGHLHHRYQEEKVYQYLKSMCLCFESMKVKFCAQRLLTLVNIRSASCGHIDRKPVVVLTFQTL